jgi:hypothetical protein
MIKSLSRCRGAMEAIFLSDKSTVDGRYLKHFVFDPGTIRVGSMFLFPIEMPPRNDWDHWINFWHNYATTGGKVKVLLGKWSSTTHGILQWYYRKEDSDLQQIEGGRIFHYKLVLGYQLTRSTSIYQ